MENGASFFVFTHICQCLGMRLACKRCLCVCVCAGTHECICESFAVHLIGSQRIVTDIKCSLSFCASLLAKLISLSPVNSRQDEFFLEIFLILPLHLSLSYQYEAASAYCPCCLGGLFRFSCSEKAGVWSVQGVTRPQLNFHTSVRTTYQYQCCQKY